MSILGGITKKKPQAPTVKVGTAPVPHRARTPDERRKLVEAKAIKRRENIPQYAKIITAEGGEISLSAAQRADYVVLLSDEKNRTVEILCSIDATLKGSVDQDFQSIKQRCEARGYTVTRAFATREIISIVYESFGRASSDEETGRGESQFQIAYDALLREAMLEGVSDIHIEVRRTQAIVRFRKHGSLAIRHEWAVSYARSMGSVIYGVIAEEKDVTFNPTVPQDAVIDRQIEGQSLRVRLATMPAYPQGFDMVMRLLPMGRAQKVQEMSALGYAEHHVRNIEKAMAKPVGVTILAGTTGSGKSTSLTTMISRRIARFEGRIKVITVEDPPEYYIEGATQTPVIRSKAAKGVNPFAMAIKAAMRSDPDVLMVGEVRDPDSAELLIHAVQSGHQAFTTVHAPSAIGIVSRLRSLGVADDILGSQDFLSGLIYQALVPVLCKSCSIPIDTYRRTVKNGSNDGELIRRILRVVPNLERNDVRFRNSAGCKSCVQGVTGRTVVAEVVVPDTTMISYFAEGKDAQAWLHFRQNGGATALDHGIEKMRVGICCPHDVEEKLGLIDAQAEEVRIDRPAPMSADPITVSEVPASDPAFDDSTPIEFDDNEESSFEEDDWLSSDDFEEPSLSSRPTAEVHYLSFEGTTNESKE